MTFEAVRKKAGAVSYFLLKDDRPIADGDQVGATVSKGKNVSPCRPNRHVRMCAPSMRVCKHACEGGCAGYLKSRGYKADKNATVHAVRGTCRGRIWIVAYQDSKARGGKIGLMQEGLTRFLLIDTDYEDPIMTPSCINDKEGRHTVN